MERDDVITPDSGGYRKTILGNLSWIVFADGLNYLISFFFVMYLTRKIGDYQYGVLGYLGSLLSIFFVFAELGVGAYLTRKWVTDITRFSEEYQALNGIKILLSSVVLVVVLTYGRIVHPEILPEILLVFLTSFVGVLRDSNNIFFASRNLFRYKSLALIIERITAVVLGVLLLSLGLSLRGYLAGALVAALLSWWYQFRHLTVKFRFSLHYRTCVALVRNSLPFLFLFASSVLLRRMDVVLIQLLDGFRSVGWYKAAVGISSVFDFLPGLLMMALYPTLRQLYLRDFAKLTYLFNKAVKFLIVLGAALAVGIGMLSGRIIGVVYPPEFAPAVTPLALLAVAEMFFFVNALYGTLLTMENKERAIGWIMFFMMVLNVVLNLWLISRWSITAAATVRLITEGVYFMLTRRISAVRLNLSYLPSVGLNSALLAVCVGLFLHWPLLPLVVISAAVYGTSSLLLFRSVDGDDVVLLKKLFTRAI